MYSIGSILFFARGEKDPCFSDRRTHFMCTSCEGLSDGLLTEVRHRMTAVGRT